MRGAGTHIENCHFLKDYRRDRSIRRRIAARRFHSPRFRENQLLQEIRPERVWCLVTMRYYTGTISPQRSRQKAPEADRL